MMQTMLLLLEKIARSHDENFEMNLKGIMSTEEPLRETLILLGVNIKEDTGENIVIESHDFLQKLSEAIEEGEVG